MKNSSKLLVVTAVGVVVGGVLGLLFAPDKGNQTREKIAKESNKLLKKIKGVNRERIAKVKKKLENKLQKVNAKLEGFAKEEAKPA